MGRFHPYIHIISYKRHSYGLWGFKIGIWTNTGYMIIGRGVAEPIRPSQHVQTRTRTWKNSTRSNPLKTHLKPFTILSGRQHVVACVYDEGKPFCARKRRSDRSIPRTLGFARENMFSSGYRLPANIATLKRWIKSRNQLVALCSVLSWGC